MSTSQKLHLRIMPAFCSLLLPTHYAKNLAGKIDRSLKADFFILTIFDFISNYTNFELFHAILFLQDNLFVADLHWVT